MYEDAARIRESGLSEEAGQARKLKWASGERGNTLGTAAVILQGLDAWIHNTLVSWIQTPT